ncbi:CTLH/CRA C-terminal to lish motif domain-containing protein [Mycotypha africana]|uniref:CTLH/CRA C-terminal to lish motif domain-containing protein n=1 Tax=Mycotypha africana TaxID=64632 RepID=UPI002301AB1B|nr:CTLH/CRA C-terminal to lish motif domain-containing protein [Mycotypha africana]KAI8991026.1 CTLH/CRA C-terminal to lish motif domain-containing protein [Mycotypha africana]
MIVGSKQSIEKDRVSTSLKTNPEAIMEGMLTTCLEMQKKHSSMQDAILKKLENFKELLEQTQQDVEQGDLDPHTAFLRIHESYKKFHFQKPQKEFDSAMKKLHKEIDRRFKQDISAIYHPEAFVGKKNVINRSLALHFVRQGQFELCEEFLNEADIPADDEIRDTVEQLRHQFEQMYTIMYQLEAEQDLTEAIKWAQENHDGLVKLGSTLEFNLHKIRFIQLLLSGEAIQAIQYGREHFTPFGEKHYAGLPAYKGCFTDIKRLMTAPLFIKDLANSRYADLCSPSNWVEIKREFQKDFCSLLKMSAESPLYTSVYVGTTALPVIKKVYTIMASKKTEWSQQDELPVEIPLNDDLRYHSVFACPVSKEQATDNNPPMMMPCGHVICKESLMRLSRSSRASSRFKCPYCPSESSADQAVQVYF